MRVLRLIIFPVFVTSLKIDCPKSRNKRSFVSIDFDTVYEETLAPSSISTQLVNTLQWEGIQAFGYILGGNSTYYQ